MLINDNDCEMKSHGIFEDAINRWFIPLDEDQVVNLLFEPQLQDGTFCFHSSKTNNNKFFLTVKFNGKLYQLPILRLPVGNVYTIGNREKLFFNSLAEIFSNVLINRVRIKVEEARKVVFTNFVKCPIPVKKWFIPGKFDTQAKEHFIESANSNSFAVWMNRANDFTLAMKTPTYKSFKIHNHRSGYTIDSKTFFNDLEQLVAHYQRFPFPNENDQEIKCILKPFYCSSFYACMVEERIKELTIPQTLNKVPFNGYMREFAEIIVKSKQNNSGFSETRKLNSMEKNRYLNHSIYDHTRVILKNTNDDYINANYVEAEFQRFPPAYILCQAPIKKTMEDHWQMIIQENITTIVILANFIEKGIPKCIKYWPDLNSEMKVLNDEFCLMNVKEEVESDLTRIHLLLKNDSKNTQTKILILHYIAWPDNGVPKNFLTIFKLLALTHQRRVLDNPSSILVHCSAGVGRAGTFVILDMILNKIMRNGVSTIIDIKGCVLKARKQRASLVCKWGQYEFIYHMIMKYIKQKLG